MIHFIVVARRRPPEAGTLLTRIVGSCLRAASARGFCRVLRATMRFQFAYLPDTDFRFENRLDRLQPEL
jgi:hypothetical protein